MKYGASQVVMGEQEIARAMFAAVPDAPREPVLSSVEEATTMTSRAKPARRETTRCSFRLKVPSLKPVRIRRTKLRRKRGLYASVPTNRGVEAHPFRCHSGAA